MRGVPHHLLTAAQDSSKGSPWSALLVLVLVGGAIYVVLRWLRPRLREQRHRAWEKAGLLPEQVDAEGRDLPEWDPDRRSRASRSGYEPPNDLR